MLHHPSVAHNCHSDTAARLTAEVAGLLADEDLSHLPAVLRRPGPQLCNQIPPSYAEAMHRLHAGRPQWPHLPLWLRVGRAIARLVRRAIAAEVAAIARAVTRLRQDLDRLSGRRAG
jgi:hypothetical protein